MSNKTDVETLKRITEDLRDAVLALDELRAPVVGMHYGTTLSLAGRIRNLAFNLREKRDEMAARVKMLESELEAVQQASRQYTQFSIEGLRDKIEKACQRAAIPLSPVIPPFEHYTYREDSNGVTITPPGGGRALTILHVERTPVIDSLLTRLLVVRVPSSGAVKVVDSPAARELVGKLVTATRDRWPQF